MKENIAILFSGGRTSGRLSKWVKDNWSHKYNLKFVFCNTGCEDDRTLDFVDQCDKNFNLDLTWIEAKVMPKGVGTSYTIVDYKTASRTGKPFESIIEKFGLPNQDFPHCTRELKIEPSKKFLKDYFDGNNFKLALGIRVDEPNRLNQTKTDNEKLFPFAYDNPMTKGDVLLWWRNQSFDLDLPEHLGNCTWCWKKSDKKLLTIAREYPDVFHFPLMMEIKHMYTSNFERKDKRVMFRGYKTVNDIVELSRNPDNDSFVEKSYIQPTLDIFQDRCPEECGSVWNE